MSEMVERVARAILIRRYGPGATEDCVLTEGDLQDAVVAIAAMREPTPAMIAAADDHVAESIQNKTPCGFRTVYPAMIDAALKD